MRILIYTTTWMGIPSVTRHRSPRALEAGCMTSLVQFGIRTATPHQRAQAARWNVEMVTPRQLQSFDMSTISGPIYLSIDLDGLDPSVAPGVSHHEPGGLTFREVLDIIDGLPGPIIGADVVELNPSRDLVDMTAMVAAKLVKEIAGAMLAGDRTPHPRESFAQLRPQVARHAIGA